MKYSLLVCVPSPFCTEKDSREGSFVLRKVDLHFSGRVPGEVVHEKTGFVADNCEMVFYYLPELAAFQRPFLLNWKSKVPVSCRIPSSFRDSIKQQNFDFLLALYCGLNRVEERVAVTWPA